MATKKQDFIIKKTETLELNFYAVRSLDGKWFRSKGQNGYGKSWVDNLADAKIYGKPGPAKAQVTFWGTHYPQFGIPELVHFTNGSANYLDQTERVTKIKEKKEIEKAQYEVNKIERTINNYIVKNNFNANYVSSMCDDLDKAKAKLKKLQNK